MTKRGKPRNVVALSGGKDSTAMLLMMLEKDIVVDEIVFCDTTVEFPGMYDHLDKLEQNLGRKITRLIPDHDFEYYVLYHEKKNSKVPKTSKYYNTTGYGFPTFQVRWCTRKFKINPMDKFLRQTDTNYIGITKDEEHRTKRKKDTLLRIH